MPFEITILGSNSAIPVYGRHHTAQHLSIRNHQLLIDCGEGTQLRMQQFGVKAQRLEAIFISHLHGDHYLGLVGLLSSMHLMGRTKALHLFGPPPLNEIVVTHMRHSDTTLRYRVHFHPLNMDQPAMIYETRHFTVRTVPVQHRIPCVGFVFEEQPYPRRINKRRLPEDISVAELALLKKGEDVSDGQGGIKYLNKDYTLPARKSRSYAYLTDTLYLPELAAVIKGVNLLYHEATFQTEKELKATKTYHATAGQAAQLASDAGVQKLLIGHFSARYKDLEPLEKEAQKVFANSYLALEGKKFTIEHQ